MSGGQAGSRGGGRQSRWHRVRRKCEERRAGHERRRRKTTAAEEMGELAEAAINALARRVLADAKRRTDFMERLAFHEMQDHRQPVRFAKLQ